MSENFKYLTGKNGKRYIKDLKNTTIDQFNEIAGREFNTLTPIEKKRKYNLFVMILQLAGILRKDEEEDDKLGMKPNNDN